jgi:hypothetical protein
MSRPMYRDRPCSSPLRVVPSERSISICVHWRLYNNDKNHHILTTELGSLPLGKSFFMILACARE